MFEEEFWRHFQRVCESSSHSAGGCESSGWISLSELGMLFSDPVIVALLMHEIPESAGVEEASVCHWLQSGIRQHCVEQRTMRLDFRCLSALLVRLLRSYTVPKDLLGLLDAEPDEAETASAVL